MGGSMEALVKIAKKSLKVALNENRVNEETLNMLLAKAESIINKQPLTVISDGINDL